VRGFFISAANVTLDGLTISDAAFGPLQNGGGIQFIGGGTLTVNNCAITNNFANSAGGIDNIGGTVNVVNTTLSGNQAGGGGVAGAIWNDGGTLNVTNSTISGNISNTNEAGAIWNNNGGTTTLLNTTISGNQASLVGGGIWNQFGTVNVENTIIAGNTSTGTTSNDVEEAFTSQGNNLIGDTDGSTGFGGSDLAGTGLTPLDPKLGPLADYGGPTQTMALLAGSPAIDAGNNSGVPANDQRGFARVANGTVDIGAFEAQPVTFTVRNTNDSGPGSLRQYVQDNNLLGGDNTISFAIPTTDPGFNPATGQFTITLTGGEIDITQNVTLSGPGAGVLAVSGNATGRIFGTKATVNINGLNLTDGQSVGASGGAINQTGGSLTLADCVLSNNHVSGNNGGAVESAGSSSLTIINCTFSGNSSDGNGGAIDSPGVTLTVNGSTFDHNTTNVGGGGALSIGTGTVNLTNCTFTANSAASGFGGAINSNFAADFTVLNCTIAGNTASVGGGVINTGFGTFTLTNSIVANDSAAGGGNDVAGVIASGGNCLVKDTSPGSGSFTPGPGDLAAGTDPMLGPLADNGGPTKTMALLHRSPAIDAGNAPTAPLTDQRGLPRFGNTDIGALEYQFKVTNTSDSGPGSLRQAILNSNGTALQSGNPNVIQFDIPGGGVQTITPLSQLPAITNPVVIDGYSQASSSPNTLAVGDNAVLVVRLDGSSAGTGTNGLVLDVNNSTVQGLSITGFQAGSSGGGFGIFVQGSNDIIRGNFIGLLPDGTTPAGNGGDGVGIFAASNNVVGGATPADRNIISGNSGDGVEISGGSGNQVQGNFIGTDATAG
jgi:predicted outer membrane repeat protein